MNDPFRAYKHQGKPVVTSDDRDRFGLHLEQFGEGEELAITVTAWESTRSLKQNAALHTSLTAWAKHKSAGLLSNAELREVVEQIKDDLLALQFGYVVRQNQFTGEIIKTLVKAHTSHLTRAEFTTLFDLAAVQAAEDHFVMVMPSEYLEAKKKQEKESRARS